MKKILVIVANPNEESFSFAIANTYIETSIAQGDSVELVDLYRSEHPQPFFTFDPKISAEQAASRKLFQEKIAKADELVFIFPYWWGSAPAILHNFIDWNFSRGFAFHYVNSRPKGLLKGKSVRIFTTTGAPSFFYALTGANRRLKHTFKQQIIAFCGMELKSFNSFGGMDNKSKKLAGVLEKVRQIASALDQ